MRRGSGRIRGAGGPPFSASKRRSVWIVIARLVLIVAIGSAATGCRRHKTELPSSFKSRDVRVLLFDSTEGCRVRIDGKYAIRTKDGRVLKKGRKLRWTTIVSREGLVVGDLDPVEGPVFIESENDSILHVSPRRDATFGPALQYAGSLKVGLTSSGSVRAVNVVDLDSYVAGVVPNESPPSFHDESLATQSIVARTYAMYLMATRTGRPFDLRASEGDQVYRGLRFDAFAKRAIEAVNRTRGLVLAWESPEGLRAFCTYYSSACGGRSQCLSDVQSGNAPGPLCGGVACDYCKIAGDSVYRWGPTETPLSDLLARLKSRDDSFASWKSIESVEVTRLTEWGRVGEVTLIGDGENRARMIGERFRLAVGSRVMRSTDCEVVLTGDRLRFQNGKGFGHGLGLCQWGMEGQARQGATAEKILRFYYPGAKLVRAY